MTTKDQYIEFENYNKLPLFYQSWWLDALCEKWDVLLYNPKGVIKSVWPLPIRQKLGFTLIENPLLTPFMGPLFFNTSADGSMEQWDEEEVAIKHLLAAMPHYHSLTFTTLPNHANFLPFRHKHFQIEAKLTYQISLEQSLENIKAQMQKRLLRYINTANNKMKIVECEDVPMDFFEQHEATFKNKTTPYPYSRSLLTTIIEAAQQKKQGVLLAAKVDRQYLGFLWVAYDENSMYQLLSCYNSTQQRNGVIPALTFFAIQKAKKLGLKVYDFEGSVHPGIEPFFRKFGGKRHLYFSFQHTPSKLWRIKKMLRS